MTDVAKDAPPESEPVPTAPGEAPPEPTASPPPEDWATRYKYLLADFENYRRRAERERETLSRQARGAMLRELLPIIEAFRGAREAVLRLPADDPVRRGMELLDREWLTLLRHEGVEPVAKVGGAFRPDEAEAVGEAPATPSVAPGHIAEIVQQGYRFFGGLLRPAKVIVGRETTPEAAVDADPTERAS
ncbi:MAG TPA: nucleotide exchange factor GrpE [Thermoplasmata archaeon]|nr:nucleotide exchange factor GrpE [Thermoplasmata archaeon]